MSEGNRSGSCSEDCDVRIARVVGGHSENGMSTVCLESPVCRFVTGSGSGCISSLLEPVRVVSVIWGGFLGH